MQVFSIIICGRKKKMVWAKSQRKSSKFCQPNANYLRTSGSLTNKRKLAIVNISSGLALAPIKSTPIYCATKAAIHSATKALRYQLENTSVKVFEMIPPPVETEMTKDQNQAKMKPEQVVKEFLNSFQNDKFESNIGKIKFFRLMQRVSPKWADNLKKND